jgi:orotidine-5'-phosphate decarboxylase
VKIIGKHMHKKIILSLDSKDTAISNIIKHHNQIDIFKIGPVVFSAPGPKILDLLPKVFLDLKLHDIPSIVSETVKGLSQNESIKFITVHASGGPKMLKEAVKAAHFDTQLLAVTVLTSFVEQDLKDIGVNKKISKQVLDLASMAWDQGITGFVCSPFEAEMLRNNFPEATLVTPGIRPKGSESNDQNRFATPKEAIEWGADYLVIGRAITNSKNPTETINSIYKQINS